MKTSSLLLYSHLLQLENATFVDIYEHFTCIVCVIKSVHFGVPFLVLPFFSTKMKYIMFDYETFGGDFYPLLKIFSK